MLIEILLFSHFSAFESLGYVCCQGYLKIGIVNNILRIIQIFSSLDFWAVLYFEILLKLFYTQNPDLVDCVWLIHYMVEWIPWYVKLAQHMQINKSITLLCK